MLILSSHPAQRIYGKRGINRCAKTGGAFAADCTAITGPYTLGTVIYGSEDFMMACMTEEEETAEFMQKLCDFLIAYAKAYKQARANGIMIAESTTSMISPAMMSECSHHG